MDNSEEKLEKIIDSVVDTFNFHGVSIVDFELSPRGIPIISVKVSKSKMKKTLDDTLNFVYWTIWTLLYGKYEEDKKELEINLMYAEVA